MYLKHLAIINYKSCQGVAIDLEKDHPSTFIGINDSGKSALLRSIGLLLDPKAPFSVANEARHTSDISNTLLNSGECDKIFKKFNWPTFLNTSSGSAIVGEFEIEEGEITDEFNEAASSQLKWAIENRSNNSIVLLKYFENSNAVGKYFLCIGDSSSTPLTLWNKKPAELQTLRKEKALSDEEIRNDNKKGRFASIELIRALYNKIGFSLAWAEAPAFVKVDLPLFPVYRYIDWNTSLSDIENLANDVMKGKIEISKGKLTKEALALSQSATDEVNKEFESLTKELTQDLKSIKAIKAQVTFSVSEKVSDLIINKTTGDGDIRLDSQGEGIKRQILFAFLKWASKRTIPEAHTIKKFIWCFDEPEAHLYPTAQREMFTIISSLAKGNYQILLGTHSTIFVDRMRINDIYKIKLDEKYSEVLKCKTIEDIHEALGVKNSDILFFDKFTAVEGESEQILIPYFYKLYTGRSMEEDAVKLISLGGSGEYKRNKEILESILNDFKKTDSVVHYIFDADTGQAGQNIHLVGICDLEDLMPNNLWIRLAHEECGIVLTDQDLDVLRAQLNPNVAAMKLHKLLGSRVANDAAKTAFLPSKTKCAQILQTYITDRAHIPQRIQDIFESTLV